MRHRRHPFGEKCVTMTPHEILFEVEEIKKLKARYYRLMDTKQFDLLEDVFTEDATFDDRAAINAGDPSEGNPDDIFTTDGFMKNRKEIMHIMRTMAAPPMRSFHHGHMPEIDITSPTTATGVWAMEDIVYWPMNGPCQKLHGYGYYYDTYVKQGGKWKVKTSKLTRLWVDVTPNP